MKKYFILLAFIFTTSYHFAENIPIAAINLGQQPFVFITDWNPGETILKIIAKSSGIENLGNLDIITQKVNLLIELLAANEKNNFYISNTTFMNQKSKYFPHHFASFDSRDNTGAMRSIKDATKHRTAIPALLFKGIYTVDMLIEEVKTSKPYNTSFNSQQRQHTHNIYLQVRHDCKVNGQAMPSQYSEKVLIGHISQ